jgi:hypothetical protein
MLTRAIFGMVLTGLLAFGAPKPALAQFAVIDVASIAQLVQECETLQQQLSTAENQLNQARSEYAAITGNRGMQLLLSGTQRNYLPTNCQLAGERECGPYACPGRLNVAHSTGAAGRGPSEPGAAPGHGTNVAE